MTIPFASNGALTDASWKTLEESPLDNLQVTLCTCGVLMGGARDARPDCPFHAPDSKTNSREQAIRWLLSAAQEALPYVTQEGRWALRTKGMYSDIGAARNLMEAIEALKRVGSGE